MNEEHSQTPARPRRSRKQTLLSVLLGLVILLCGGVIGSGLTLHFLWGRLMTGIHNPRAGEMPERLTGRIDRMLDLNDEQRARVEEIIREKQQVFLEMRADFFPRVNSLIEDLHSAIATELDDKQRATWDTRLNHLQELFIPEQYRESEEQPSP
jgi:hypothetical protein